MADRGSDPKPAAAAGDCRCRQMRLKPLILLWVGIWLVLGGCSPQPSEPETASAPQSPAADYAGTIVAVGNSLTAGLGVPEDQAYPARLARRLAADGRHYRVINAGVSGETSSGALSRIGWVISSLEPDIVILETGANDGLRGLDPELLKNNMDRLVGILKGHDIQVILAGMQMPPNFGRTYTRAFAAIYPQIAAKHGVLFVPFFLEGVAGRVHLNQADRMHPTADGYARIVETLYPYVVTAVERHRGA